jgi:hypothetical protein
MLKEWKQQGMPGGLGYLENQITNQISKMGKRWMGEALNLCQQEHKSSYIAHQECRQPAMYKGDHNKRINTLHQGQQIRRA